MSGPPARKVLIVDDDASVRMGLRRLVQAAGYEVEVFAEAREFLARPADPARPACLVVDVRMPGMSGLELVDVIAGTPRALPVVFITGMRTMPSASSAHACGAVAFLDKPVDDTVLLEAIEKGELSLNPLNQEGGHYRHQLASPAAAVSGKVFLVDDEPSVRRSLTRLLRVAGLEVASFPSGEALLAEVSGAGPACVVADLRMPGLTGPRAAGRAGAPRPQPARCCSSAAMPTSPAACAR